MQFDGLHVNILKPSLCTVSTRTALLRPNVLQLLVGP